jgi:adenylate kinase family enzyme
MLQYRNKTRPDMAEGCEERFDLDFFKWIWNYPKTKRPEILNRLKQLSTDKKIIVLKSPKEVQQFIEEIH